MKTAEQWFQEYGVSHKNPVNKVIHWICVPAIFFSIIGLLSTIKLPFFEDLKLLGMFMHAGTAFLIIGLLFYLRLSLSVFFGMVIFSVLTLVLILAVETKIETAPWIFFLIVFVVAWIGQFIGHEIEGAKPSFFKDLQFLLIGPAWLISFILKKLKISL